SRLGPLAHFRLPRSRTARACPTPRPGASRAGCADDADCGIMRAASARCAHDRQERAMSRSPASKPSTPHARAHAARWVALAFVWLLAAPLASAQDWGDSQEDWSTAPAQTPATTSSNRSSTYRRAPGSGWSLQAGVGFTAEPDTFLMNFEVPYAFNGWVSAGPA